MDLAEIGEELEVEFGRPVIRHGEGVQPHSATAQLALRPFCCSIHKMKFEEVIQ